MPGTFPCHRLQRKLLVSDPGMHHGTCVTHVPWCMSGSLTHCGGENVPGTSGACATRNFTYLEKSPYIENNVWTGVMKFLCTHEKDVVVCVYSTNEENKQQHYTRVTVLTVRDDSVNIFRNIASIPDEKKKDFHTSIPCSVCVLPWCHNRLLMTAQMYHATYMTIVTRAREKGHLTRQMSILSTNPHVRSIYNRWS